ncbi:MAG TPA: MCP four helix bundle domain-containing protein, partial [Anaerovoracaceae bacterium]|nr:MCP four helix bundle domain-containing protein [Anaerovoracaceae bacterium]
MQFKNLKIRKKLIFSFILISVLCAAMGIFASYNLKVLDQSDTELYEHMTVPLSEIGEISTEFERTRVYLNSAIAAGTPAEVQQNTDKITAIRSNVSGIMEKFATTVLSAEVKQAYDELGAARKDYGAALDKALALAKENKDMEALALVSDSGELGKASAAEEAAIDKIVAMQIADAKAKSEANTATANRTVLITLIIAGVIFILSLIIGFYISGIITKPLNKVVHMLEEMSKGHLKERLNIESTDEIGMMAKTMDSFAEGLQSLVGIMDQISQGKTDAVIEVNDDQDEISPSLKKTLDTIKSLDNEIELNIKAITEGKLDTRANAELYSGTWKELIQGINSLIDAFVGPINVTAEYVERISKGNIPPKITDIYLGDFNEIKNNLNNCIDVMDGLINETSRLTVAIQEGKLDQRGNSAEFNGSWGGLVTGVNDLIDAFVSPINIMAEYMERIGRGEIPPVITDTYYGDFNEIKNSINSCLGGLGALVEGKDVLLKMSSKYFNDKVEGQYPGIFNEISNSINSVVDTLLEVIGVLNQIGTGDLSMLDAIDRMVFDERDNLSPAFIVMMRNIKALVDETGTLSKSAVEGKLSTRGDANKFKGEFAKVIEGINETLDAVIAPVTEASSVLKEMAGGNLHATMVGDYRGDHAELKQAVNTTIDNLLTYVGDISHVLTEIGEGNLNLSVTA